MMLTVLPIAYVVLKMGGSPWSVFVVYLILSVLAYFVNLYIVLPMMKVKFVTYAKCVLKPCLVVLLLSLIVPSGLKLFLETSMFLSLLTIFLTIICTITFSFFFGLDEDERSLIVSKINLVIPKLHKSM